MSEEQKKQIILLLNIIFWSIFYIIIGLLLATISIINGHNIVNILGEFVFFK